MGRYTTGGVSRDIIAGAAAGLAAIWVANKLDEAMYRSGSPARIRQTLAARPGGMDPAHVLAQRAADAVGVDVGNSKDNAVGHTIQYGLAASMGALYGLLRGMAPGVATGRGALFGVALFVLKDEIGNTALGTAGNPLKYPVRDHVRGAAANTLFGVVTDLGTRLMSPYRDEVVIDQGPSLTERLDRGRGYLGQVGGELYEQGRGYLGQGLDYATQLAEQARARVPVAELSDAARRGRAYAGQVADSVRDRMPSADEAADYARSGQARARRAASDMRDRLPEFDAADAARQARRRASRLADQARGYVSEIPDTPLARAKAWLFG